MHKDNKEGEITMNKLFVLYKYFLLHLLSYKAVKGHLLWYSNRYQSYYIIAQYYIQ